LEALRGARERSLVLVRRLSRRRRVLDHAAQVRVEGVEDLLLVLLRVARREGDVADAVPRPGEDRVRRVLGDELSELLLGLAGLAGLLLEAAGEPELRLEGGRRRRARSLLSLVVRL